MTQECVEDLISNITRFKRFQKTKPKLVVRLNCGSGIKRFRKPSYWFSGLSKREVTMYR
jgi:hypothetical protein